MGAGMKGFASLRGSLEMTGEDFFLVVSNGGTRQQVTFRLEGKGAKGLRKNVGQTLQVTGSGGQGRPAGAGRIEVESVEPRPAERRTSLARCARGGGRGRRAGRGHALDVRSNQGLSVRLPERAGYTWAD